MQVSCFISNISSNLKIIFFKPLAGQSLNTRFLTPYLDSMSGSTFTNGANFAVVGSSTLPKYVPFSLNIQVMQFQHFKARSLEMANSGR
jgi:hypothetical protein